MHKKLIEQTAPTLEQVRFELQTSLKGIREEFDDHLDSINANTNEIQSNYEYLQRLDIKLDHLTEKIEHMQQWMSRTTGMPLEEEPYQNILLTKEEKEVFFSLFVLKNPVTYKELATQLRISDFLVRSYITNLVEKGIPIIKTYANNKPYLQLESHFREHQNRYNILQISQKRIEDF